MAKTEQYFEGTKEEMERFARNFKKQPKIKEGDGVFFCKINLGGKVKNMKHGKLSTKAKVEKAEKTK